MKKSQSQTNGILEYETADYFLKGSGGQITFNSLNLTFWPELYPRIRKHGNSQSQ